MRPSRFGHTLWDRIFNEFQLNRFSLKRFRHCYLAAFEHFGKFPKQISNLSLNLGRKVRTNVDLGNVMFDGGGSLTLVGFPPGAQCFLSDEAHERLPLPLAMLIDADAEPIEPWNS